ncbi:MULTISPECIES: MgtC/SapB family protein [unclassified Romboutsia]|uniref:MgtC/SapB family protein n=1 Tax=unclassified Romboutsia TaxID=2626894 RepID=UPI0008227D43|nr:MULTISPECIES: MgtC/SapB family protein [unclassified Romboutsia]SCI14116.1 magnesium transport protein MgtC [uncultured Clostridium sp.]
MKLIDYLPKLLLASAIGYIVGLERSSRKHSQIGVGTVSILVIGSTLLTIISKYGLSGADPSRLIANIITAVGFLCGSVIFMKPTEEENNDVVLKGLTTSVTLFALTGVGIAIGLGHYGLAITATAIVELNILLSKARKKMRSKKEDLRN